MLSRKVCCPICGEERESLGRHAAAHGLTAAQLKSQHGYLTFSDMVVKKINELYVTRRSKWGIYYRKEQRIATITKRSLTDQDIKSHLNGKFPVSVHTAKGLSRWLIFDVDSYMGLYEAAIVTTSLIDRLESYYASEDIHIVFSGEKGYHVCLFFNRMVENSGLVAFAKKVTEFNRGNEYVNIEYRPESNDGKAIKLPLSYHYVTGAFCPFIDKEYRPMPDSYEYLLSIRQVEPLDFKAFSQEQAIQQLKGRVSKLEPSETKGNIYSDSHLGDIWENGLPPGGGQRNKYELPLAIYLKDSGYGRQEAKEKLYQFYDREHKAKRTKDSASSCKVEIEKTVDKVFDKNLSLRHKLSEFEGEVLSFFPPNTRPTIAKVLRLCQVKDKEGYSFLAPKYIASVTGKSRPTVYRHINKALGKILFRVVDGDHSQEKNSLYFSPLSRPLFVDKFTMPVENEHDFLMVVEYCWYRYRLGYVRSDEILFESLILKEGDFKKLPEEVRQKVVSVLQEDHVRHIAQNVCGTVGSILLCAGIYEIEQLLAVKKSKPQRFSEIFLPDSFLGSPVLKYLRKGVAW